jgi:DNA primase
VDFARQVKDSVDIVNVIGRYVRLKKAASNRWTGLCPFHQEKSPSFSVNSALNIYKCFGCGVAGDVFKFVQQIENITFWEALKMLAEQHGIPLPKRSDASDAETRLRAACYQMHEIAVEVFRGLLRSNAGLSARQYLGRRGLTPDIAETFQLGYSDPSGQTLLKRLQQEGFTPEQLRESALVRERESGGFYDSFRGRLMFPIHNESGKVIGFGGRALNDEDQPKYLNSIKSLLYDKGTVLYNMHRAKEAIRRNQRAVLVEGYMDVIGVYSAGVHEVVAVCGTALVETQVRAIKRHTDSIILNFDPDSAGVRAATQRIPLLLAEHLKVRIVDLEDGLDPDEFVKKYGAEAYQDRVAKAVSYFPWLADQARRKNGSSAEGRVEALKSLLPALQHIPDSAERLAIADELADLLGLSPEERVRTGFRKAAQDRRSAIPHSAQMSKLPPREKILLQALLQSPEAREAVLPRLAEEYLTSFRSKTVFEVLRRMIDSDVEVDFAALEARLDNANKALLHELVTADELEEGEKGATHLDRALACIQQMERAKVSGSKSDLKTQIRAAERAGDFNKALQLMQELQELERRPVAD